MANKIVNYFGINTENLSIETSTVCQFPLSKSPIQKFSEGLFQHYYKLKPIQSLFKYDLISSNNQYSIFSHCNKLFINGQIYSFESRIIDIQAYQSTLYLLQDSKISIFKLPSLKLFKSYQVPGQSTSIKVRNFGDLVYVQSSKSILRIDSLNYTHRQNFNEIITAIDSIFASDCQICICFQSRLMKILDFSTSETSISFKTPAKVDQVFAVSEKVIFLFSLDTLYSFSCKHEVITYSIVFNTKILKVIKYCEETEQFIILNKNYCKLFLLSLDEEARLAKYVSFALNAPAYNFFHLVQANDVPDQALYEGNSLHRIWIVHEERVEVYELDVVSTKTTGFRYGPGLEGLDLVTGSGAGVGEGGNDENGKVAEFDLQPIEKYVKNELSSEKINLITSQITLKLEEIIPVCVQNTFSIAAPGIEKNVREIVQQSIPDLAQLLSQGLEDLKALQTQIFSGLSTLSQFQLNPNPNPDPNPVPVPSSSLTFKQLIESQDEETYKTLIIKNLIPHLISQTPADELIDLGEILFNLSLQGLSLIHI